MRQMEAGSEAWILKACPEACPGGLRDPGPLAGYCPAELAANQRRAPASGSPGFQDPLDVSSSGAGPALCMLAEELNTISVLIGWGGHPLLCGELQGRGMQLEGPCSPNPISSHQNVWWRPTAG